MPETKSIHCDLMVIGSGMAGMAASLFAAQGGINTVQVGITGEINFASGLLDLLGVHPIGQGARRTDPWAGIKQLTADDPSHPYAYIKVKHIRHAMKKFMDFLDDTGLPYETNGESNSQVVTPVGTLKTTYAVPKSMAAGVRALTDQTPTLLVDFIGLKGFSARQMIETLGSRWPTLKHLRIAFPGIRGEVFTEHAARAMDTKPARQALVDTVRPHLGAAEAVGFPAVLGMYRTEEVRMDLEAALGLPVFEIPTMLPAVTGLRLREAFERRLPKMGVTAFYQQKVLRADVMQDDDFEFIVGQPSPSLRISAKKAILASGRFFGKGLQADRHAIRETLFDLPVVQPEDRRKWHHKDLLHADGHPINRAGLDVDEHFRPMDKNRQVIHHNLHAIGSILAHQDWIRQKCGSGLSIATAFAAVNATGLVTPKNSNAFDIAGHR
jgi:glycerol-3-phosphate dehydrogenase subunit B